MSRVVGTALRIFGIAGVSFSLVAQQAPPPAAPGGEVDELMALMNTPIESASKRVQKAIDSPQAIEVITADQIRASGFFRLADVLRLATAVQVWDADPDRCNVTIRGVNPAGNPRTVQILLDGVPMFNIIAGPVDINGLPVPMDAIERIEIVRGPSSSLYGANAQFGVISITTKRAKEGMAGSLRAGFGDHSSNRQQGFLAYGSQSFSLTAGIGAGSNGNLNVPMDYLARPGLTVPQNTDSKYLQGFVRPEVNLGNAKLWAAFGHGKTGETDQISYSPAALVPYQANPAGAGVALFPNVATTRQLLQGGWTQTWSPAWRTEVKIGRKTYGMSLDPLQVVPGSLINSPALLGVLVGTDPALATSHDLFYDQVTESSLQANWDPSATFHLVAGGDSKSIKTKECLTIGLMGDQTLKASGGFISVDWTLGQFTLSTGARFSNEDLGGSTTSPRASVVYKVDESSVVRAGYFTSTRSPMLQERDNVTGNSPAVTSIFTANRDIKSEKVDSLELGYRKAWAKWSLDLTYFHVNMKDLIVNKTVGLHASGKPITQWQNVPEKFTDSGIEVTLTGELTSGWLLGFNGSTASFKDPIYTTGEQADYAPKAQGNLWSRYRRGMFFGFVAVQHVGSYTVSMPGGAAGIRQTLDATTQFHFNAGVEPLKGLSVSLYGVNATKATSPTTNAAVLNQFGIRNARRELGLQASYRF